jgi:alkyl sulfatase BDS1-like metallo-beta-lactamase superfamily hydrolase
MKIFSILCWILLMSCAQKTAEVKQVRALPAPQDLKEQCEAQDVEPTVEEVAPDVFMARGFDLANTYLIRTTEGNVIVDAASCPTRARAQKEALLAKAPGPIRALIYTHSHLDHVGGASAWVEDDTEIWATDALYPHLMKQYGVFRETESRRAARQWGYHVTEAQMSCSAIGKRLDLVEAMNIGILKPTHTFSGQKTLQFGETVIELVEAHGETHDQLFLWIPKLETLMPGDNYYASFPNLYTVRGTSPRPVDQWIQSLDKMRHKDPVLLLPSHTGPVRGRETIRQVLTDYRDAIQWVHDAVVRGANAGLGVDGLVAQTGLPEHLANKPYLKEMYGQVDWSVKAIYGNNLGWFDGKPEQLYRPGDATAREIDLMGGVEKVLQQADQALQAEDPRWAAHLYAKVRDSGLVEAGSADAAFARALEKLGEELYNTNGRAYLLESAHELREGWEPLPTPEINAGFLEMLPISTLFEGTTSRLMPEVSMDVHETILFEFTDLDERIFLTVRNGVAEVALNASIPGTPEPSAIVQVDSMTWKRVALGMESPLAALTSGRMKVEKLMAFKTFMGRFRKGV